MARTWSTFLSETSTVSGHSSRSLAVSHRRDGWLQQTYPIAMDPRWAAFCPISSARLAEMLSPSMSTATSDEACSGGCSTCVGGISRVVLDQAGMGDGIDQFRAGRVVWYPHQREKNCTRANKRLMRDGSCGTNGCGARFAWQRPASN